MSMTEKTTPVPLTAHDRIEQILKANRYRLPHLLADDPMIVDACAWNVADEIHRALFK